MAVQQNKVSKRVTRTRKAANRYRGLQVNHCQHCRAPRLPHRVCKVCGFYGGRQVLTIKDSSEQES